MNQSLILKDVLHKSLEEKQKFLLELANQLQVEISFPTKSHNNNNNNLDDFDFDPELMNYLAEDYQVINQSNQNTNNNQNNNLLIIPEQQNLRPNSVMSFRSQSVLPMNHTGGSVQKIDDTEFSNFLKVSDSNQEVLRYNSMSVRKMKADRIKDTSTYQERVSSTSTTGKYGCKICGSIHKLSMLTSRKSMKCHEPMLYLVRDFLLKYDVAPDVLWKKLFISGDETCETEMIERFYSIVLPEHNNDEDWMYSLRKRSYETRNCTWSSSAGNCKQLHEQGIIDLFLEPLRLIRPSVKSPLTDTRKYLKKDDIKNLEVERILNNNINPVQQLLNNNHVQPLLNNNNNIVTLASIFDSDEFPEFQDSKRKREE